MSEYIFRDSQYGRNGIPELTIKDAKILWPHFGGTVNKFTKEIERKFCLILDEETADYISKFGVKVRYREPNPNYDNEQEPIPYIDVFVFWRNREGDFVKRPPEIYMSTRGAKVRTRITEETAAELDSADIEKLALTIRFRPWEMAGRTGYKPVLSKLWAITAPDALDEMYAEFWGDIKDENKFIDDDEAPDFEDYN